MATDGVLVGDVAVVTGAGRNIGRAIAETFAGEGASVVVADIDADRAAATVAAVEAAGNEATAVTVDVTEEAQVQRMVEETEATYGPVDVLVNNVAVMDRAHLLDLSVEEFDRTLSVVLRGTFLCTRECARSMRDSGGGRIVNLASTSAHKGRPDAVAYATAKSGVVNFTRSAARALADHGIRVNTLSPTRTGPRTFGPWAEDDGSDGTPEGGQADERIREEIPAGRLGTPEDHARAALFLVSPENDFVNGTELLVDGGRSA